MTIKKLLLGLSISTGFVLVMAFLLKAPSESEQLINEMAQEISFNSKVKSMTPTTLPSREIASVIENSGLKTPIKLEAYQVPLEQRNSLKEYSEIHHKVFSNETEKNRRKDLLNDSRFLQELSHLLAASNSADLEFATLQNTAIDLLLEAESKYDSSAAREALMKIVKDPQIENENLAKSDREVLAGVKAEVLYMWTAQNPAMATLIYSELPGAVSQKIWDNVKASQEANYQESLTEVTSADH